MLERQREGVAKGWQCYIELSGGKPLAELATGPPPLRRTHPIGYDLTIGGVKWSDGNLQMNSNGR
jgi:hypothetical protein